MSGWFWGRPWPALWRLRLALRHRTSWVPVAPLAAVMVLALVVGVARLAFTGTVNFDPDTSAAVAGAAASHHGGGLVTAGSGSGGTSGSSGTRTAGAPKAVSSRSGRPQAPCS